MDGSLSSCQIRGRTPTHRRPTAFPLQTLQAAPPRLGSSRKSQREASDSSETPATTCGPEHTGCRWFSHQSCLTLRPRGQQPARLLCPWESPGKNTGVGCHSHLQAIFVTQGSDPCLLHRRWILYR